MFEPLITISVVSHGQNALVNQFLFDIEKVCSSDVFVVITENIRDNVPIETGALRGRAEVKVNRQPKGFGANHNIAFVRCRTQLFCVANPDVRLHNDPFPALIAELKEHHAAVAGPLVRSPNGDIEDSARRFPTFLRLMRKAVFGSAGPDYPTDNGSMNVDWIAGMFMLFSASAFRAVQGFDESYFLYYEDVDICRRLWRNGLSVLYEPRVEVIHDARRASRRNIRLAVQHIRSGLRFLLSGR